MRVALMGTCNGSQWRETLKPLLKCEYFDPVVDDWNEEAQKQEIYEREHANYVLYAITPKMVGVYAIAEVVDDSNKQSEKTLFCVLHEDEEECFSLAQRKSLIAVANMVEQNGGLFFTSLEEVAEFLNEQV